MVWVIFSYTLPSGEEREIFIDEDDNTLYGIANRINSEKSLDLKAIVVNDGSGEDAPWRLIVTHNKSGEVNDAEFPTFYFVDGDEEFEMEEERAAQNAIVRVNGFDVEFESNRIDKLFPGIILDLKDAAPGKEFTIRITEDRQKVESKIKGLVQKINEVLSFIQQQNTLDEKSNTSNTLGGDVTIQNVESLVRRLVQNPVDTDAGPLHFRDIGVTFQRNGLLEVSDDKLKKALDANFRAVAQFFTGITDHGDGFVGQVSDALKSYTKPNGVVQSRTDGIKQRIKDIDRQIETTEKNLEDKRKTLQDKFANLDSAMAKLKGQQQYVQANLGGGGATGISLG